MSLNNEIRLLSGHKLTVSAPGEMGPPMKRPHKDPVVQDYPVGRFPKPALSFTFLPLCGDGCPA